MNIFSDVKNIKYIDLSNFQNDKIISSIFNNATLDLLYVCQDETIITNQNANNCCTYNFTNDVCESEIETTSNYYPKRNKSTGITIGAIIGIVAGIVAFIAIITLVICCIKRKKSLFQNSNQSGSKSKDNISTTDMPLEDSQISHLTVKNGYEYQPDVQSAIPKVNVILETTSQNKIKIIIDPEKPMNELIQFYFQIINQPTLYRDSSIRFLMNANLIMHDSKELIKNYINKKNEFNVIIVDDLDDKIIPISSN